MNNQERFWRYSMLGFIFFLFASVVLVKLVHIQLSPQADEFRTQGELYSGSYRTMYPARGQIYDRWGHLLAGNTTVYEVGVDLRSVEDPESVAFAANVVLGMDYKEALDIASTPSTSTAVYAVLQRFVPPEKVAQIRALKDDLIQDYGEEQPIKSLQGLVFLPRLQRSYPEKDLASNVLGFVSREGVGYFGVEEKYNDLLSGFPEEVWIPQNPKQVEELPEIPPGTSLILTIDRQIQATVEQILDSAVERNGAKGGVILVMDPNTGEIYAMTVSSRLDLNEYWKYPDMVSGSTPFNRAVGTDYEPGSVFKVFTMSAALDSGTVAPDTPFLDTGSFEIGGVVIRNWDYGAWGPQDMIGCMQHSLNVCLSWVASQMGPKVFYSYLQDFGIGHTSGVDLAGEVSGRLRIPGDENWYAADLGTNSFGQGVSATPVQMLMGVSAIANEGKMMVPHVLRAMVNNDHQYEPPPQISGIPIKPETAQTLTQMLAQSLENEASQALVTGYRLAGKTGTAEIPTPYGYTSGATNASFVGWGPVDDPRFLVYIWLEAPTSSIWGSLVAAPIFKEVVERLVVHLHIPPDGVRMSMNGQ